MYWVPIIKMKKVLQGMNACIRSGRARQQYGVSLQCKKSLLYFGLYGFTGILLHLKPAIITAFIRNFKKIAGHLFEFISLHPCFAVRVSLKL